MFQRVTSGLLLVLACAVAAQSHPGRLDSNGGHHDRNSGGYHYHRGGPSGSSSPTRPTVPRFEPTILAPGYDKLRSRSAEAREAAAPDESLDDLDFESRAYRVIDSRTPARFVSAATAASLVRTWTDATGVHSVEAALESYLHGQVFLKKPDGSQTRLPLDRLSAPDQAFVLEANDIKALYGRVVGVTDGDTIKVLDGEKQQLTIRLEGIDAPESGQAFGTQSKKRLSDLVFGKDVRVEWREHDQYGRTLGSIFAGGVAANLVMVKDGMAWHYKQYSDDEILARAEMDARARKVGLWRDPNPIAPWQFRRSRSATAPAAPMITPRQPVTAVASPAAREVTVYVTKSGTKYHTGNCRHVASNKIPIDLAGAKARYQPCSVRGPPR